MALKVADIFAAQCVVDSHPERPRTSLRCIAATSTYSGARIRGQYTLNTCLFFGLLVVLVCLDIATYSRTFVFVPPFTIAFVINQLI